MNMRSEWVDARYDFWLDFYGTPWKARRQLRRELKATRIADLAAGDGPLSQRRRLRLRPEGSSGPLAQAS